MVDAQRTLCALDGPGRGRFPTEIGDDVGAAHHAIGEMTVLEIASSANLAGEIERHDRAGTGRHGR